MVPGSVQATYLCLPVKSLGVCWLNFKGMLAVECSQAQVPLSDSYPALYRTHPAVTAVLGKASREANRHQSCVSASCRAECNIKSCPISSLQHEALHGYPSVYEAKRRLLLMMRCSASTASTEDSTFWRLERRRAMHCLCLLQQRCSAIHIQRRASCTAASTGSSGTGHPCPDLWYSTILSTILVTSARVAVSTYMNMLVMCTLSVLSSHRGGSVSMSNLGILNSSSGQRAHLCSSINSRRRFLDTCTIT